MQDFPELAALGPRIMVCGPSNAGKSTLTAALGRKLGTPPIHLDVLYHQPNTNWAPRPKDEFIAAHEAAIAGDTWVMEGNYFGTITPRLARATGVVLLGTGRWAGLYRYIRRTLFERQRAGMLEGGIDRLNLGMMRFIVLEQPKKRERDRGILAAAGLPMVQLESMAELQALYRAWGLER